MSVLKFFSLFNLFAAFAEALPDMEAGDTLPPEPDEPTDYLLPGTLALIDDHKLAFVESRRPTDTGVVYRLHVLAKGRDGYLHLSGWFISRPSWAVEDWWTPDMLQTTTAATEVAAVAVQ